MEDEEFDLVIPPGTPRTIIRDAALKFDVELVSVTRPLNYANMVNDERELLALRGKKEEIEKANEFLYQKIKEFIDS
ncbi:hypothetical protein [Methanocorpusculum labreanum]|uniref:Uncharacterized protein n=1 Tax=Methanocorpusculum labreanum (strain ATCC 43576 / DSM 4855 / Z) TaxID=410358 RepID=A2SQ92_METLZ|nr:hypothetical protein [Methanocorpusculum labreanum]ABN06498.1 hypothetical protein Mlab_0322 [Methanocorpusculum labreanum Z]